MAQVKKGGPPQNERVSNPLPLPLSVLDELKATPDLLSIVLVGSFARGDSDEYSDIDLHVIVDGVRPADRFERLNGLRRLSVNFVQRGHQEKILTEPKEAMWGILPARQARILHDPSGYYADLQRRAQAFTWAQVVEKAGPIISRHLAGLTEETHKVLGGLGRGNFEKAMYAASDLAPSLAHVSALANGALIPTENRYFSTVRAAEPDAIWGELLWQALGLNDEPLRPRLKAAARLYARSVALYAAHLRPADAELALETAELVRGVLD